jgi:DNA modification methylase
MAKADISKRVVDHSWDFRGQKTKFNTHGFHTYPAMMIPQIARRLIEKYGKTAKTILDPFVGSGTVLVECKVNNQIRQAIGVDLNPLALLISRVKTTPIKPSTLLNSHTAILEGCTADIKKFREGKLKITPPTFSNIDFWFKPDVKIALTILRDNIMRIENEKVRDFFWVTFSEIVRKVSNTRGGEFKLYRIPEEKLKNHSPPVFEIFRKKSVENISAMEEFFSKANKCKIDVFHSDTRHLAKIPDEYIDLIVTSPPYGDSRTTVAYGQFSRLALQWLLFENDIVKNIDKDSLGGKSANNLEFDLGSAALVDIIERISKRDERRAREVLSFYVDFGDCIKEIDRVTKPGAFLCFVVGNRTVKEIQIPTDLIIAEMFQRYGYKHHVTIVRSIPSKRMPKKNSPTNEKGKLVSTMNEEYIVVLEKK